jgi:hypothetical protein
MKYALIFLFTCVLAIASAQNDDNEMVSGAPVYAYKLVTAVCSERYRKYSKPWAECISQGYRKVSHYDDDNEYLPPRRLRSRAYQLDYFTDKQPQCCFCSNGGDGAGACTTVNQCNKRKYDGYRCTQTGEESGCTWNKGGVFGPGCM